MFDAAGNMTRSETGQQLVYDGWNRLVQVKSSGGVLLASYGYDGVGRRVSETPAGGSVTGLYYSAAWQVVEERVGGVAKASYVWSPVYVDALVSRDRDADGNGSLEERLYVLADANHNVTALVSVAGVVLERYTYDAFGSVQVRDAAGAVKPAGTGYAWVYRHQGGRQSEVSGLVSYRHREYSPTLKRWATTDPIRFRAGDVNLYRYVGNGPSSWLDPEGTVKLGQLFDFQLEMGGRDRLGMRTSGRTEALKEAIEKIKNGMLKDVNCDDIQELHDEINISINSRIGDAERNPKLGDRGHSYRIDLEKQLREVIRQSLDECYDKQKKQANCPPEDPARPGGQIKFATREEAMRAAAIIAAGVAAETAKRAAEKAVDRAKLLPKILIKRATGIILLPEFMLPGYEGPA